MSDSTRKRARALEAKYEAAVKVVGNRESRYSGSREWDITRAAAFDQLADIIGTAATNDEPRALFALGRLYEVVERTLEPLRVVEEYERLHDSLAREKEPKAFDPTAL